MGYGGYHPYPRRFGGGKPHLQTIHESLNDQRGTALDASNPNSIVWLENMAIARALYFDGWECNRRLSLQWDPRRTTDMLPRWETIFAITVPPNASDEARRTVLTRRWERFGHLANHTLMYDKLTEELGSFFVAIEYIPLALAYVIVPDGTYPWGVTNPHGITWMSTVAHMLVKLQNPGGYTEDEFYRAAGRVKDILDPICPAWMTFDWYRAPISPPVALLDGPSGAGFYLDDDHNLDNNIFDS